MTQPIDLNRIRALVHSNQREGNTNPREPKATIVVDRDARIRTGDTVRPDERGQVSRIQQDTFHAGWEEAEFRIVETRMPSNTRKVISREGVRGWLYSFQTEYLDTYTMFSYFDGSFYQVMVIAPQVENRFRTPNIAHLYSDGRICMGEGMNSGRRTLEDAYAKSVLWANGFSAMIHGNLDRFPFNYND